MKSSIIARLEALQERYKELELLFTEPKLISNQENFRYIVKEYTQLKNIVNCFHNWLNIQENIRNLECLMQDSEMINIVQEEIKIHHINSKQLERQLQILLLPKDPNDVYGCILEIRAGAGGNEAALFVKDLFRMYSRFIETKNWQIKIINTNDSEHGGHKEIIAKVSNEGSYSQLKFESGGHRVQRIPETESNGRIHTSTCTVAVLPYIKEKSFPDINYNDLRIDSFRSSGAGGQHVNTTDSAIRITHVPTGIVVECQDERSQHKNKTKALTILKARLRAAESQRRQQQESCIRRDLLGSGDRSDRIRTYNFPQRRITDHRIGLTTHQLEDVINGNLNILIQPIIHEYQTKQLDKFIKGL